MRDTYRVPKAEYGKEIMVEVPGSKSITNRALLLAALSDRVCTLKGVLFSDDSRAFLDSLSKLGFDLELNEEKKEVRVKGESGRIPNKSAAINVRSAGTASRFLTVFLALAGGDYELQASEQMCKRPMQPLLSILEEAGVSITYLGEDGHFPFRIHSEGLSLKEVQVDTTISSQFASALLMSGVLLKDGLKVTLLGSRMEGSYIQMTAEMMKQFGISIERTEATYFVRGNQCATVDEYQIEPDLSGACYFYAMAPLLKTDVIVKNIHKPSLQGDIKFLDILESMGCKIHETEAGLLVSGKHLDSYKGVRLSMKDFSDQTMTLAAIAGFATTETVIENIGHIRFQESDRMNAILTELQRMGFQCEEVPELDGIRIHPGNVTHETEVETYEDHRMAMAFTLVGLRTGQIVIKNPDCCRKTFENYFDVIDQLFVNN